MQPDKLLTRITRKLKKEVIKWRWKKWLRSAQDYYVLEKEFISVFVNLDKLEATRALDSRKTNDLFPVNEITLVDLEEKITIFGSSIERRDVNKNWHSDFIHDISWPVDWHWSIRKVRNDGSDVKVPWELSRCHFLLPLAIRYKQTGQEKYAIEAIETIESWIRLNPVGKGINWTCAMDVAIRAITWLLVYEQISKSSSLEAEFKWEFYKSVYSHGRFIESNLEGPGWYAANHYLANLAGLFFIGALVPEFSHTAKSWKDFAVRELEEEIVRQVNSDGGCFENSTSYHRLSFELFFYPYWLGEKIGCKFSESYQNRLMKMIEVVSLINKPNSQVPQIGDNDSGRLLDFGEHVLDHRYILDIGAMQFNMNGLARNTDAVSKTAKILYGQVSLQTLPKGEQKLAGMKAKLSCLRDTGWCIFEIHPWWSICNAGPRNSNMQHPGHAHRDKLSIELVYRSENILIDPGTFVYTSDPIAREQFRSAAYHNVLCMKANEKCSDVAFFVEPLLSGKIREAVSDEKEARVVAELDCDGIVWTRTIVANTHRYSVFDELDKETQMVVGNLNFHPDVETVITDNSKLTARLCLKTGAELTICFFGITSINLEESFYSEGYGVREKSKRLSYHVSSTLSGFWLEG
ncbi:MAG: alginate lyase family protein [Pseudomonadales bacterium]